VRTSGERGSLKDSLRSQGVRTNGEGGSLKDSLRSQGVRIRERGILEDSLR